MSKPLYPKTLQGPSSSNAFYNQPNDTSNDEALARELQAQFNRDNRVVLAQPVPPQLPYKCGACGKEHMVCGAMNGALFQCINCGVQNRILLQPNATIVVDQSRRRGGWVPIPIFCSIM